MKKTIIILFSATLLLTSVSLHAKPPISSPIACTQEEWAAGFQNAYNLIILGRINPLQNSTYQNTLSLAYTAQTPDYYDGLVSGAAKAWAKLQGPVVSGPKKFPGGPIPTTTIVRYTILTVLVQFSMADGSAYEVEYSGIIQ